jgi:hypothetical protein
LSSLEEIKNVRESDRFVEINLRLSDRSKDANEKVLFLIHVAEMKMA